MDIPDDITSAMGFSSFGGQPKKKRKHNHNPSPSPAAPDFHEASTTSTLAGVMPSTGLGGADWLRKNESGAGGNADELDLDDDNDVVKVGGPTTWHGGGVALSTGQQENDHDSVRSSDGIRQETGTLAGPTHQLPERPGPAAQPILRGQGSGGRSSKPWWEGYYDPQSNENPWERLEEKMGLKAQGSWLPRGHGYPAKQQRRQDV
jgi:hypothetical protein